VSAEKTVGVADVGVVGVGIDDEGDPVLRMELETPPLGEVAEGQEVAVLGKKEMTLLGVKSSPI
jgi:hypothetical protein